MACPYFRPQAPLDSGSWFPAPRLPLGDAYSGTCQARAEEHAPAEDCLRELCNRGYARGRCERFPPASPGDAVRFSITSEVNGRLRMVYVIEAAHAPLEHGALEFAIGESRLDPCLPLLEAQARAFVGSYLRRRGLAGSATAR